MLFNSVAFLVFLPIVWGCYHALRGSQARAVLLLVASYVFYMWWRVDYVVLLLLSTAVDYTCGLALGRADRALARRLTLAASVVVNLGLLVSFKYWNFLAGQVLSIGRMFDPAFELPLLDVLLPVGISFYTFQTMSYTIDVYRRKVEPERNPVRLALYVSFFPQLVAGPIERPGRLLPQIRSPRAATADELVSGLRLMLWGMFKKVVVADRLAIYVDIVYGEPTGHNGAQLLLATVFFAVQIYCDFSGYTDIALGCARTLGFDLMKNFRRPYLAWCPTEFWRRWHISLSTWFRDYVYIPLGGSRRGVTRGGLTLMITFLVSGLWHGANWTFIAWGAVHGLMVLIERAVRRALGLGPSRGDARLGVRLVGAAITIPGVIIAWVFFRADSLSSATYILTHLFSDLTLQGISCHLYRTHLLTSLILVGVVVGFDILEEWRARQQADSLWAILPRPLRWCGYWSVAVCIVLLGQLAGTQQFVYFQF